MNRGACKTALFNLLGNLQFDLGSGLVGFKTKSPKLKHWNDVSATVQPAFFLAQGAQKPMEPPAPGGPRAWFFDYTGYVYVNTQGEADPTSVLNPILDAIDAAFSPFPGQPQTLGGIVQWARIEGAIETFEGTLGDQEVALIPIRLLAT